MGINLLDSTGKTPLNQYYSINTGAEVSAKYTVAVNFKLYIVNEALIQVPTLRHKQALFKFSRMTINGQPGINMTKF